jgi:hypothetical protein
VKPRRAGLVSNGFGALFVTVLGTGTAALLVKSAWVRGLLYHGQHQTASTIYGRELFTSQSALEVSTCTGTTQVEDVGDDLVP